MRTKIKFIFSFSDISTLIGQEHTVKGWIKTTRGQKNCTFVEINDGSSFHNLQIIADASVPQFNELLPKLTTGTSISVIGILVQNPNNEHLIEMRASRITILGESNPETYVLQKKRHSFEFLRTIAHLRPRTNTFGAVARVRNALAYATHSFFQERDFLYIHTPIITASDCEGAGEMFQVTTLNIENPPKDNASIDWSQDFFHKQSFLTVSGQLNAETYACALSDVYTFGPTFRAENSNTSRHLAEFWMVEPEIAFCDLEENITYAETYLKYVISYVLKTCPEDIAFFDRYVDPGIQKRLINVVETPFERATYSYAIRILEKSGESFEFPVKWGLDLHSEHERFLTEKFFQKPVILTDYPKKIKAFYMRDNADEKTVAAMDILMPGIGEIIGGSQREERLDVLEKKITDSNLDKKAYWWYLDLRRYGSVPHSGFGAGFERLVQFVTGLENIRDVSAFPRSPGKVEF